MKKINLLICSLAFLLIGNQSLHAQWVQTNGPFGGTVNCIARIGSVIYAGVDDGIYISNDEAKSWQKASVINSYCCLKILTFSDTVAILYSQPAYDSDKLYCITSYDEGASWSAAVLIETGRFSESRYICKVKSTIFVQGITGKFTSFDYGKTWSPLNVPPFGDYMDNFITDGNSMLAWMINDTTFVSKYYVSHDGSVSWQYVCDGNDKSESFLQDSVMLFTTYDSLSGAALIRTPDFGASWDTVMKPDSGFYIAYILYYKGDIYLYQYQQSPPYSWIHYVSHDQGLTWSPATLPSKYVSVNFLAGTLPLANGDLLGIDIVQNEEVLKCYVAALDTFYTPTTGMKAEGVGMLRSSQNVLYASCGDGLFRSMDGGLSWQITQAPIADMVDFITIGDTIIGITNGYTNYLERSFDNGLSWDTIRVPYENVWQDYASITQIGSRIYVSGDSIQYTDDLGASWYSLPALPNFYDFTGFIEALNGKLFSVTNGGVIYRFNQGIQQWDSVAGFFSPGAHNGNYLYLVDSTLVMAGRMAFLSTTGNGDTWSVATLNGLPLDIYYDIMIPRCIVETNGIWIGVIGGYYIYTTRDKGNNWSLLQGGTLPFVPADVSIFNNVLYAGSYYSGVWRRSGTFQTFSGQVYYDKNNNHIKDIGEKGSSNIILQVNPTGWVASTDTGGYYSLATDALADTLSPNLPVSFATVSPSYYLTSGATSNLDFGIYIVPGIADLAADITNINVFRYGFETVLKLTALNKGSLDQPAQVQLILDSTLMFVSAIPAPSSINGDTLYWNSDTLHFLDSYTINVNVMPAFTDTLGTLVHCYAMVSPVINDTMPADNYCQLSAVIVGSFDPNDKECSQGNYYTITQLANKEELVYVIRFQNTGTYMATNVQITDTLSEYLDLSTFRVISSSQIMQWTLSKNGIADFIFNNINLPTSSSDEVNSCGFVKYGIHFKKDAQVGNAVTNTAYIYFDANAPIQTNITSTLITFPTGIPNEGLLPTTSSGILAYPNPASGFINVRLTHPGLGNSHLLIFNNLGSMVMNLQLMNDSASIDLSKMAEGLYLGSWKDRNGAPIGSFRFIVIKH